MMRAGFQVLAAVDVDSVAISSLRVNLIETRPPGLDPVSNALVRDLTTFRPSQLAELIGTGSVDVIVGGPPCQGFSTARQVDGANHGARLKEDPRRRLYKEFLCHVDFFQPRVFVMENVLGIRTAAGGEYFTHMQKEARVLGANIGRPGYRVHSQIEDAWQLGVPQKRRRQIIIGLRNDLPGYFPSVLKPVSRAEAQPCLGEAIGDLPILRAGGGEDERDYDPGRRAEHFRRFGNKARRYLNHVLEIGLAQHLTNHVARPHSERDLCDFALLQEGENSATAIRDRGVVFQFPYKKDHFKDRYTRQSRWRPCSTIVAHLSKDGLMFIHPTQNRSITPREAARVQSFPDWFRFPEARTHSFRLIGNAVPPLIGESLGLAIKAFLKSGRILRTDAKRRIAPLSTMPHSGSQRPMVSNKASAYVPNSQIEAARVLGILAELNRHDLRALTAREFLRGWHALLFLFPGLHPDNALDHGDIIETTSGSKVVLGGFEKLLSRHYVRSGWPVLLDLIGREAWRRYESGEIGDDDFYCVKAQRAGMGYPCESELKTDDEGAAIQ
ncbi:MAG: DNA cytosine methyltransferase [Gammaproteobacteria bacterium]|nr:MAG: DNA cytosine methyltransferase [Gammaproteobacteria bacterium]